jgi:hypothetical protein
MTRQNLMTKVSDDGFCPVLSNDCCGVWHLERAEKRQRSFRMGNAAVQDLTEIYRPSSLAQPGGPHSGQGDWSRLFTLVHLCLHFWKNFQGGAAQVPNVQ